ncbi:ABC transporter permease [Altererythrobacter sp.]|uniref:ABC transporter permease n=1 Tax=Altererythrobacter sp. TaxID=1872480 RepID=UPI003CFC6E60
MSETMPQNARLSRLQAAYVVARRDFKAILFSRSFLFFLLGPLFPAVVFMMSGGLGNAAKDRANEVVIAMQMPASDTAAFSAAHHKIEAELGYGRIPHFRYYKPVEEIGAIDVPALLADSSGRYGATLTGTLENPVLTGTPERLGAWRGFVTMHLALARGGGELSYPALQTEITQSSGARTKDQRQDTAQISMTLLFLLMMLLAGMVLSNLVEEKANKIIEILAAALPMEAVFLGKLFAMLAVSLAGIAVWFSAVGLVILLAGDFGGIKQLLIGMPDPGVGWPLFCLLFVINFSMGYLLIGSIFLAIGALASTVREVQTLSMPVTMLQLFIFFFASFTLVDGAPLLELAAILFPLSSPFAMTARAAQHVELWPHAIAFVYQMLWVVLFIHWGSWLFRKRVMKSGSAGRARPKLSLLRRLLPAKGQAGRTQK